MTYDAARRNYITHCALDGITVLPPSVTSLCCWVAGLGDIGYTRTATAKPYLAGLHFYWDCLGLDELTAFKDPGLQLTMHFRKTVSNTRRTFLSLRYRILRKLLRFNGSRNF